MRISRKGEYALRAVVGIARSSPPSQPVPIHDLSRSARIPVKFLEQILLLLKRGGILKSKRGIGGGYQLEKRPGEITLGEIVRLVDGPFVPLSCVTAVPSHGAPGSACECGVLGGCGLGRAFSGLRQLVDEYLENVTVEDILEMEQPHDALAFEI